MTAVESSPSAPVKAAGQVDQAVRGTALNLVGSIVAAVVSFGTVGVITNVYGQNGAGVFFAAIAAFTLTANAIRLGAESGLTYFVSRFRADDRHLAIPVVVRTAVVATGSLGVILGLAGLLLAPAISGVLTSDADYAATTATMIRILAVAVPTFAVSQVMFGATRGFGTMRPSLIAGQIVRPVSQLIFVVMVVTTTDELWPLALAWAGSSLATMATVTVWLRARLSRVRANNAVGALDSSTSDTGPLETQTGFQRAEYVRFTAPRALSDLLSALLERLDVVLVAVLIGEAGAGMYGASNRLILAGQLMMIATAQAMAPLLAANFLQGHLEAAQRSLRTITGWNVTLLWPIFLSLAFGAETALSVFGAEFTEAAPLVVVLSLSFLVIIAMGTGDTVLMMTGDSFASLINHAISLVIMVAASLILLPRFGIVGAAWAWALSRIVLRALAGGRVWYTKRIHSMGRPVITAAVVATAAYVPTGFVLHGLLGTNWAAVLAHVTTGAIIHLALLTQVREILELDQLLAVVAKRNTTKDRG